MPVTRINKCRALSLQGMELNGWFLILHILLETYTIYFMHKFNMIFVFHFYILGLMPWIWTNFSVEGLKFESPSEWNSYKGFNLEHCSIPPLLRSEYEGGSSNVWMLFGLFFMFSNFYWFTLHNQTCVALANLRWSMTKDWIENQTSLNLVMVIGSAYLLIPKAVYIKSSQTCLMLSIE